MPGEFNGAIWRERLNCLDDVEFDALCLDYFPSVYNKFSRGLRRDEKVNLLLDHCRRNPATAVKLDKHLPGLLGLPEKLLDEEKVVLQSPPVLQEWRADQKTRNAILGVLQKRVNPVGLRVLVFKVLGTGAYDNLSGDTHIERCISFLEEIERREKGEELLAELAATYPDVKP